MLVRYAQMFTLCTLNLNFSIELNLNLCTYVNISVNLCIYVWDQYSSQLPIGLLVQLVEYCTGIAEVMDLNPVQTWIFVRPLFPLLLKK